jgi:hypothetical protein
MFYRSRTGEAQTAAARPFNIKRLAALDTGPFKRTTGSELLL